MENCTYQKHINSKNLVEISRTGDENEWNQTTFYFCPDCNKDLQELQIINPVMERLTSTLIKVPYNGILTRRQLKELAPKMKGINYTFRNDEDIIKEELKLLRGKK